MTYTDLIEHFGSLSEIARAINIKPPSVHEWKKGGIPEQRQLEFHRLTAGKLRADPEVIAKYRELIPE